MPRVWCQIIVAEIEEFYGFASFDQIHDFNDLFGHEAIPRKSQVLNRFVRLKELTKVVKILFIVDHDLFCLKMYQLSIIFESVEHQRHRILSCL